MNLRAAIGATLGAILTVSGVFAQDFSRVTIEATEVATGLYALTGEGGNIGLCIGPDAAFLIDDQYAPLTERIQAAVAALTDLPIGFVVNTHCHGDHTGGNENLRKSGTTVVAHEKARERMTQSIMNELFGKEIPPAPEGGLPVLTFNDSVTFHLNGQTIEVVHVPAAHTDGDAIVHFREANVIHCGDLFFNGMFPFIDTSVGGSVDGCIAAIDLVLARSNDATRYLPGHGAPVAGRAELLEYQRMLETSRTKVQNAMESGTDLNAIVLAKPLAELDEKWGQGWLPTDMFVRIVYTSLLGQ